MSDIIFIFTVFCSLCPMVLFTYFHDRTIRHLTQNKKAKTFTYKFKNGKFIFDSNDVLGYEAFFESKKVTVFLKNRLGGVDLKSENFTESDIEKIIKNLNTLLEQK